MIDETVEQIEDMRTHSSSEVAVTALEALRNVPAGDHATVEEYLRSLTRNCRTLRHADPSHASLYTATKSVQAAVEAADHPSVEAARTATLEAIEDVITSITQAKERAAENAASLIEPGGTYLTIDYSTTLLETLEHATLDPTDPAIVYTMEARPRFLGRKMARELATFDGIEPRLIVDSAVGRVINTCDAVIVGMTCVVEDTLYNRVGTYPTALTAAANDIPMYAVGAEAKVVGDGFVFSSEERPPSEVSLEPLADVVIENHSYDATPVSLLEAVITEDGHRFADE